LVFKIYHERNLRFFAMSWLNVYNNNVMMGKFLTSSWASLQTKSKCSLKSVRSNSFQMGFQPYTFAWPQLLMNASSWKTRMRNCVGEPRFNYPAANQVNLIFSFTFHALIPCHRTQLGMPLFSQLSLKKKRGIKILVSLARLIYKTHLEIGVNLWKFTCG
jgi:hypothetical protein